jgi:hypothetical protein
MSNSIEYKGRTITSDHTGNYVAINGVDYTREWHNTDVQDPVQFAKAWIDTDADVPETIESVKDAEALIAAARPWDDDDYGSERQVNLENRVYFYVESILDPKEFEAFENYCLKASVEDRLDAALYVVNGDVNWLSKWA